MSHLDRLPDELLYEILCFSMIRNTPFDIGDCIRTAKSVDSSIKVDAVVDVRPREDDQICEWSLGTVSSDELTNAYFKEKDERRTKKLHIEKSTSEWPLHDSSIEIQQPHLLDWRIAGSVSNHLRRLGKIAFFSCKVFAMDINLVQMLQETSLTRLSSEDQQTASKYIDSIILINRNLQSPSTFISLPRRIAGFPHLKRFDFFVGGRSGEPTAWMVKAAKNRIQASSRFVDALTSIGVPTGKLVIGILISPDTQWSRHEATMEDSIYPMLKVWANMKAGKGTKKADG